MAEPAAEAQIDPVVDPVVVELWKAWVAETRRQGKRTGACLQTFAAGHRAGRAENAQERELDRQTEKILGRENEALKDENKRLTETATRARREEGRLFQENQAARDLLHNLRLSLGLCGATLGQAELDQINQVLGDYGLVSGSVRRGGL
jgi:hypothetical protein